MASGGTAALVTESIIGWRQWADLNPSSIHAYQHRNRYLFSGRWTRRTRARISSTRHGRKRVHCAQSLVPGGIPRPADRYAILIDESKKLWTLSDTSNTPEPFTEVQAGHAAARPGMMVAGRILADDYTNIHVKVYADGILHHERDVTDDAPFSMPRPCGDATGRSKSPAQRGRP